MWEKSSERRAGRRLTCERSSLPSARRQARKYCSKYWIDSSEGVFRRQVVRMSLFAIGRITGCFGVKGYLKVRPSTHALRRMAQLRNVFLGSSEAEAVSY